MKNKEESNQQHQFKEDEYDKNPPIEFVEKNKKEKETRTLEDDKNDDIEKFKKGELGAEHNRYNDDGPPKGVIRKLDI